MKDRLAQLADSVRELKETIINIGEAFAGFVDHLRYWFNPSNWPGEIDALLSSGKFESTFLTLTLVLIIIRMLGARWATKVIFWGWAIYWILRVIL